MPLKLVRRGKYWYLRGTVRGQTVYESAQTDRRDAAEEIRIRREAELLDRANRGESDWADFTQAAELYLTAGGESRFLAPLIRHFRNRPLKQIDQRAVDAAAKALYPNAAPATLVRQVYGPIAAVLRLAAKRGLTPFREIEKPKLPRTKTEWSTPERFQKLLPHCGDRLARGLILITYTGMRIGEALSLTWEENVHLAQRMVFLPVTKNGDPRGVYLPLPALAALAAVAPAKRKGPVVGYKERTAFTKALKRACARAGVSYLSPHKQGRHTFATWLRQGGADLALIKDAVGWRSINSAARYTHVAPGEAARAADALPDVTAKPARKTGGGRRQAGPRPPRACKIRADVSRETIRPGKSGR